MAKRESLRTLHVYFEGARIYDAAWDFFEKVQKTYGHFQSPYSEGSENTQIRMTYIGSADSPDGKQHDQYEALTPEAELWLMLNAPEGTRVV